MRRIEWHSPISGVVMLVVQDIARTVGELMRWAEIVGNASGLADPDAVSPMELRTGV